MQRETVLVKCPLCDMYHEPVMLGTTEVLSCEKAQMRTPIAISGSFGDRGLPRIKATVEK